MHVTSNYDMIVIGTSQGGLNALSLVLGGLPHDFPLPLAIVQHRASDTVGALARLLAASSAIPVVEVEDKMPIQAGHAYLAPADYHMLIDVTTFALSTEAPINSARPSIDLLFESAAARFGPRTIGVIMTGASHDGASGLARIKQQGGYTLVQDPTTAESWRMPKAAMMATAVDQVVPLDSIAPALARLVTTAHVSSTAGSR